MIKTKILNLVPGCGEDDRDAHPHQGVSEGVMGARPGLQTKRGTAFSLGLAVMLGSVSGVFGLMSASAQTTELFSNDGIRLNVDTVVEFEFVESNGGYQSTFGILNLNTGDRFPVYTEVKPSDFPQDITDPSDYEDDAGLQNRDDFQGTPGNTVIQHLQEFTFAANTDYTFYLESSHNGRLAGTLYSTNSENPRSRQYAQFDGPIENIIEGGLILRWEDTGALLVGETNTDFDYDDFIVRIGGHLVWDRPGDGCYPTAGNTLGSICSPL